MWADQDVTKELVATTGAQWRSQSSDIIARERSSPLCGLEAPQPIGIEIDDLNPLALAWSCCTRGLC
jgi:hypothetical protein